MMVLTLNNPQMLICRYTKKSNQNEQSNVSFVWITEVKFDNFCRIEYSTETLYV